LQHAYIALDALVKMRVYKFYVVGLLSPKVNIVNDEHVDGNNNIDQVECIVNTK